MLIVTKWIIVNYKFVVVYTVRCQKLRFSRFKACFADCRDSTKRTNIEWGNVRSFQLWDSYRAHYSFA